MKKVQLITVLFIISITIGASCTKDTTDGGTTALDCSTISNKAFMADVNPIIQARCNVPGCHATSGNGPGALTNYSEVFANRVSIRSAIASGRMPQGGGLTTAQKNSILCWIDSGAPNN